jgi:hypothetical protein
MDNKNEVFPSHLKMVKEARHVVHAYNLSIWEAEAGGL